MCAKIRILREPSKYIALGKMTLRTPHRLFISKLATDGFVIFLPAHMFHNMPIRPISVICFFTLYSFYKYV